MNIYRAPMNGRNFEYFGEDPYLAGQIAAHYILGVQSQDVVATVKHYDANNSEYDRHGINAIIDERTLREIYLPVFEAAVKEGHVGAVMDSYNLINGEHATQNKFLNTDVLKKRLGISRHSDVRLGRHLRRYRCGEFRRLTLKCPPANS